MAMLNVFDDGTNQFLYFLYRGTFLRLNTAAVNNIKPKVNLISSQHVVNNRHAIAMACSIFEFNGNVHKCRNPDLLPYIKSFIIDNGIHVYTVDSYAELLNEFCKIDRIISNSETYEKLISNKG